MLSYVRKFAVGVAICTILSAAASSSFAGTIIKMTLDGSGPDVEYTGGTFSTFDDGNGATTGDQNTAIEFLDFLDSVESDVPLPVASFALNGLLATGPATVFNGVLVLQNFAGGILELYDSGNSLLLSGLLTTSAMTAPLGPPATGGLFTTSFAAVTGGSLAPYIDPLTMTFSMSLADINGGAGLSVTPAPSMPFPPIHLAVLNDFTADATASIAAEPIPEPASVAMLLVGAVVALAAARRNRR